MSQVINQTVVNEFILLGFSYQRQVKCAMFSIFLVIYLVTIVSNILIIILTQVDSKLQSPMYFFLCNLSCIDLCYSSANVPKGLEGMMVGRSFITFAGCAAQMYCALSLGVTQCILLAVMAWDRYIAICNPLNYVIVMNRSFCIRLAVITWCSGFLLSVVHVSLTLTVPFCGHRKIDYHSCEVTAVLRLACTDIRLREAGIFVMSVIILFIPLCIILFTYSYIISTILRMPTTAGRLKAFSTCSSHLLVVSIFFGTAMAIYMRPKSMISSKNDKVISVFYGAMTPMLNPLIYSMRNKDVMQAFQKLLWHKILSKDARFRSQKKF
ncbi:olfactory receptor 2K2-like [Pleurodeles waltl]|uniref:olfactory receptor 2K2-like n=1 Tax=Pleurodeles waltl TaxID=8319 RepID=UPI0037098FDB